MPSGLPLGINARLSNDKKGVAVELVDTDRTIQVYLYALTEEDRIIRTWPPGRSFRLHELTDVLFRLEFFGGLRQKNIPYEVLEGCPPGVSAFRASL